MIQLRKWTTCVTFTLLICALLIDPTSQEITATGTAYKILNYLKAQAIQMFKDAIKPGHKPDNSLNKIISKIDAIALWNNKNSEHVIQTITENILREGKLEMAITKLNKLIRKINHQFLLYKNYTEDPFGNKPNKVDKKKWAVSALESGTKSLQEYSMELDSVYKKTMKDLAFSNKVL